MSHRPARDGLDGRAFPGRSPAGFSGESREKTGGARVRIEDLHVTYRSPAGPVEALAGITLELQPGERVALVGPSGCGKSTLLWCLAGLVEGSSGRVSIDGEPVRPGRPRTGLILQDYGLLPWKTAEENAALGLAIRGWSKARRTERVRPLLEALGLDHVRHLYPAQLSGGQRQRVAIARALVLEPDLLLMDEPFSALDALARESLQDLMADLARRRRFTLVLVTHDIAEAAFLAERIAVLSPRPGRIVGEVHNPGAGLPGYRRDSAFFETTRQVRALLDASAEQTALRAVFNGAVTE